MIVFNTLLLNGLGNRLFQIAAAHGHAKKMDTEAWLCDFGYADYLRGPFNIKVNTDQEMHVFKGIPHVRYKENSYLYSALPSHKNIILTGYFQNENYFSHCRDEILSMFHPNESFLTYLKSDELYRKIKLYKNSISIHIRRGDYIKLRSVFAQLDGKYYCNALMHIRNRICLHEPTLVVVFSDGSPSEIEFIFSVCRKLGFENVVASENRKDITDMMLMSCCRHHIIANSSFSWWGAYLSHNFTSLHDDLVEKPKLIVGPKIWFTEIFCNSYQFRVKPEFCTPMCSNWIKVSI